VRVCAGRGELEGEGATTVIQTALRGEGKTGGRQVERCQLKRKELGERGRLDLLQKITSKRKGFAGREKIAKVMGRKGGYHSKNWGRTRFALMIETFGGRGKSVAV